jgi:DNA-binding XRE family transcriptional regulator
MIRPTLPAPLLATVQAAAEGLEVPEIAARLHLSERAVKGRLRRLRESFGVHNRTQLVAVCYQLGILQPGPVEVVSDLVLADSAPLGELVEARECAGISQAQMAARLGVSASWLSQRETGIRPFPLRLLRRYARIARVDVDRLGQGPALGVAA